MISLHGFATRNNVQMLSKWLIPTWAMHSDEVVPFFDDPVHIAEQNPANDHRLPPEAHTPPDGEPLLPTNNIYLLDLYTSCLKVYDVQHTRTRRTLRREERRHRRGLGLDL
jgi:hypothetical protein